MARYYSESRLYGRGQVVAAVVVIAGGGGGGGGFGRTGFLHRMFRFEYQAAFGKSLYA